MKRRTKTLALILSLVLTLSIVSAQTAVIQSQPLSQSAEAQVVGGNCGAAWGLGIGLAVSALSPCGVLCAALAWYDLALIGVECG